MIDRRSVLRAFLSFGGLTVLLSACKHRAPYGSEGHSGGGGGGGGGY